MKICIVGGVFSKDRFLREEMQSAPERVLEIGLKQMGHTVVTSSINEDVPSDCDVIHCHHFGYASLSASAGRTPFIFTSHNPFVASRYRSPALPYYRTVGRLLVKRADAIVALSEIEKRVFVEDLDAQIGRIQVIPNGLITDLYRRDSIQSVESGDVRLLCVAQLQSFKGIDYLLDAMRTVLKRHTSTRLEIVTNNRKLLPYYESRCKEMRIQDRVDFIGPLTMKELVDAYHRCSIYVHPSLAEDLPTCISEAMMCGKPIVATRVGGVANQVPHDAGILVDPRDVEALAEAILFLAENEAHRKHMGERAMAMASQCFDYRDMCRRHITLYESIIDEPKTKRRDRQLERAVYRLSWKVLRKTLRK